MKKILLLIFSITSLFGDTILYEKKGFSKEKILENVVYVNATNIRKTKYLKFKNPKKVKIFYVKCEKIISWIDENGNNKEFDCEQFTENTNINDVNNYFGHKNGYGITLNNEGILGEFLSIDDYLQSLTPTIYFVSDKITYKTETSFSYLGFQSVNIFSIGLGYLKNKNLSKNYNTYSGARINILFITPFGFEGSLSNFSPIIGSEYKFSENFTIGGEVRLNFLFPTQYLDFNSTFRYLSTHLFFRFYR